MRRVPMRLAVLMAAGAAATVFLLIRAASAEGNLRTPYLIFGAVGVAGLLLFLVGWVRQSRRK
jgi:hypothetical protein